MHLTYTIQKNQDEYSEWLQPFVNSKHTNIKQSILSAYSTVYPYFLNTTPISWF